MRALRKNSDTPLFVADFIAESVQDIDFVCLRDLGVRFVAFDADSTLVPYRGKNLSKKNIEFLNRELKLFDGVCIASNRVTDDLDEIASSIKAGVIRADWTMRKPNKSFFERVSNYFSAPYSEIVMIGDKVVADIYGGNRVGMKTVWVDKNGRDGFFDRFLFTRKLEDIMMRKYIED